MTLVGFYFWQEKNERKPNTQEYAQVLVVTCQKLKSEKCLLWPLPTGVLYSSSAVYSRCSCCCLDSALNWQLSVERSLCAEYNVYTIHSMEYVQCRVYTMQSTADSAHSNVFNMQCTAYTIQFRVYTVQYQVYSVQSVYSVH